jgi:hypothetical protein
MQPVEQPAPASSKDAANPAGRASASFQRGVAALAQYIAREEKIVVGRAHLEELPDGTTIKLGVFLSNQKARRERLNAEQRAALRELGIEWAAEESGRS